MASSPITSWQIDEEKLEIVTDFIFLAPRSLWRVTSAMKLKRCILLGRKAVANLDSIFKSRDIPLLTNVCIVKVMVFPVATYGCESRTINKAEHQRMILLNCSSGEDS